MNYYAVVVLWTLFYGTFVSGFSETETGTKFTNCTVVAAEYTGLSDLYYSTNGDQWTWREESRTQWDFSGQSDPCRDNWQGIACICDEGSHLGNIASLNLTAYGLVGTLPSSIGSFVRLKSLTLGKNRLDRSIPDSVGHLVFLKTLGMAENRLTGTLPPTLSNIAGLEILALKNNSLEGVIPSGFGTLRNLTYFDLYLNKLSGSIPETFSQLTRVQYLDLYANQLTGTIPSFLGGLRFLVYLYLGENLLHGTIPESIGSLSRLISFYANNNYLEGTIPSSFYNLRRLQLLFLHTNKLSGNLDNIFNPAQQQDLSIVLLNQNRLTGQLPSDLFAIRSLTVVDCSSNCMHGSIPPTICNSTNLQTLALDGMCAADHCRIKLISGFGTYRLRNTLSSDLPQCVYALPRLAALHVSGNGMPGSLPSGLQLGPALTDLALSHNLLTGDLPLSVQGRQWTSIDLSFNRLSGTLSNQFAVQQPSTQLKLTNNRLSGSVPQPVLDSRGAISILDGNLFACDYRKIDLPQEDSKLPTYQCGSNTFNVSYYFWLCATFALCLIMLIFTVYQKKWNVSFSGAFVEAFESARAALNVFDMPDAEGVPVKTRLRRFKKICDMCKLFVRLGACITAFIVVVLLPFYALMSLKSSTLSYKYAYEVSLIYLTGPTATGVALLLLVLLSVYVFLCFAVMLRRYQAGCVVFEREIDYDPLGLSGRESFSRKEQKFTREKVLVCAGLVVVDVVVVVGANVLFVYLALFGNESVLPLAQAALSVFKILWSNVSSWTIYYMAVYMHFESMNIRKTIFSWLFALTLFNNIVVPCLVVMAASSTCFYNLVEQGANIESSYTYQECLSYRVGGCYEYVPITNKSSFQPPFVYSYQCSASFVTTYAPSFVYLCIISGFMIPATRYTGYWLVRRVPPGSYIHSALMMVLPPILKPIPRDDTMLTSRGPFFDARRLLVNVLNYFGILMTFGAVFPPLAVAITFTMLSSVFYARLEVQRFLSEAVRANKLEYVQIIDADCFGIGSDRMLLRAIRVMLVLSFWFYTLFLFDTLGNAVGLEKAFWVLIVVPLLPFVLYLIFYLYSGPVFVRTKLSIMHTLGMLANMHQKETLSPMVEDRSVQLSGSTEAEC